MSEDGSLVGFFQTDSTFSTQWISTNFITYFHSGIGLLMLLQLMWKKGKGEQKIEKKTRKNVWPHRINGSSSVLHLHVHSILELIFRTNHFNLYKFFVRHVFLFSWQSSEIGASILNDFYLRQEADFEFTVSMYIILWLIKKSKLLYLGLNHDGILASCEKASMGGKPRESFPQTLFMNSGSVGT